MSSTTPGPWFRRNPSLAVIAALGLFVAISVLRFVAGDERDATLLLLVLPVALLALAFGLLVGTISAVGAVAVLITWVWSSGTELSLLGATARAVPLLLLGVLIGHASDRQRDAESVAARLAVVEERQREAAEINDTIVQNLVAAKWCVESGNTEAGIEALEGVIEAGEDLVVSLLSGLDIDVADRRRSRQPLPPVPAPPVPTP